LQFFYSFPDARLPRAIFTEDAVRASRKSYGYWAAFSLKEAGTAGINELQIAGASVQGQLDQVATGCYVLATRDPGAMPVVPWQVYGASSELRHVTLRASTQVVPEGPQLIVRKSGTPRNSGVFAFNPVREFPLLEGHCAAAALDHAVQTADLARFLSLQRAHARHLIQEFAFPNGNVYRPLLAEQDVLLRGEALDAIPQNVIFQDDSYDVFDLEWCVSMPLPLSYVLYRGLAVFFLKLPPETPWKAFRLEQYGMNTPPTLADLCKFFIESLAVVGRLKSHAMENVSSFESRLKDFL